MTESRLWDRAALTVQTGDRRLPAVASLPATLPTVTELFDFMRDAELRFATLRMRIVEQTSTTRGEDAVQYDALVRHVGDAKVTTSRPGKVLGHDYEIWISDGDLVRTYAAAHRLGTQRPIRNRPRGLDDPDFPGMSKVYEPITGLPMETLPDTFVHPGGLLPEHAGAPAAAPSRAATSWQDARRSCSNATTHARSRSSRTDPDFHISIAVDRQLGVMLRLVESIGGEVTRRAEVTDIGPDAPLPPAAFDFVFPTGTTMLY